MSVDRRPAYWTYDESVGYYYFAPVGRQPGPYLTQIHVQATIDIAADGTLAGIELGWDRMPPPPQGTPNV